MVGRIHVQRPRRCPGLGSATRRSHATRWRCHEIAGDRVLGTSLLYAGKLADAQDSLQRVVDLYVTPSGGHNPLLFVYDQRVLARARLARVLSLRAIWTGLTRKLDQASRPARSSGAGITVCWVLQDALCPIALMRGDTAGAEAAAAGLTDWAARMNATLWKTIATGWRESCSSTTAKPLGASS